MKTDTDLSIEEFCLESSAEVFSTVAELKRCCEKPDLIHIFSYIHNTVLVQSLKKELLKSFENVKVVLLKHEEKTKTKLLVYTLAQEGIYAGEEVSDVILKKLYDEYSTLKVNIEEYRNQLFLRYFTDHLTNLPNLYQLRKDLQSEDEHFTLLLLKIDNFQSINTFYGFVVGDYVIEYVSDFLKNEFADARVYRLSGTEFAILLDKDYNFYELKDYLSEVYAVLQNLIVHYQDVDIFVNFTLSSSVGRDHSNLFSKVSMALKYAEDKSLPFWIYEDRMNFENEYEKNIKFSQLVREAIEQNRVLPYFQAIYDNNQGKITKYECLARMQDEEGNILTPEQFIPIAKSLKIYDKITQIIIEKSFEEFLESEYEFSINLSIEDIMNSQLFNYIIDKLKSFPHPSRVTFELLESEAILDFNKVSRFIDEIKRRGAKIAIDDFGSGYSNFSYMIRLQVDFIKIDGSLIEHLATDKNTLIAVETIVGFAKKLGIETVAEYVVSASTLAKVKQLGIEYSQGFYIDKPSTTLCEEMSL